MADINLKPEEVAHLVPELREKFKTKLAEKFPKYDERDIQRLETDDTYAGCFLRTLKSKGDINKALEVVHESFKFRKEMGIGDLTEDSFPEELTAKKALYYQGQDNAGHPILYIRTKDNTASGSEQQTWLKKYIAWHMDIHQKKTPEQMCVVLMDMSGAGTGNVSMDITKYIITCFTTYFPTYLAYMINYEMPGLLSAFWKLVSAFLNKDQNKKIILVKKKDIQKYIPVEHQWPHMKT